jgi:hypothetical protein
VHFVAQRGSTLVKRRPPLDLAEARRGWLAADGPALSQAATLIGTRRHALRRFVFLDLLQRPASTWSCACADAGDERAQKELQLALLVDVGLQPIERAPPPRPRPCSTVPRGLDPDSVATGA